MPVSNKDSNTKVLNTSANHFHLHTDYILTKNLSLICYVKIISGLVTATRAGQDLYSVTTQAENVPVNSSLQEQNVPSVLTEHSRWKKQTLAAVYRAFASTEVNNVLLKVATA